MEMSSVEQGVACVQVCNIMTCSASMHSSIIGASLNKNLDVVSTISYDRHRVLDCFGKSSILQFRIQIRLFRIPYLGIAYKQAIQEQTDKY